MLQSIFKRPARTVLVDTGTARFRVDLSRQSGRFCVDRMMNDSGSVASAAVSDGADDPLGEGLPQDDGRWVTALLRQKPRPAAEVTLLSARVAAAVFEVPFMGGESEEEAIAMELESLTGLGTAKTQWTWKRLPGSDGLLKAWASQASLEQLMVWRQAVSAIRSCHLVAVTHPAGLPLEAESQLELWPGFALFQPFDGGAGEMQSWPGERAADSALADEGIRDAISQEALVVLTAGGRLPRELKGCPVLDLEEEAGRMRWGDRLARALDPLSQKLEMLPRLMIPKPEMTMRQLVITTFGVTGVAALVAIGHFAFLKASINHLDVQVAALRVPVDEVREGEKEIRELRRQLRTLQQGEKEEPFDILAHRLRMASLLKSLASAINKDVVIQGIHTRGLQVLVTGVSATSQGPANYIQHLNESVAATGWRASLAGREATLIHSDGGPWTFSVELSPVPVIGSNALTTAARRIK